jgi:hypothetical protein
MLVYFGEFLPKMESDQLLKINRLDEKDFNIAWCGMSEKIRLHFMTVKSGIKNFH